jgi:MFS superfamily sulfate permease-like transporter
VLLTTLIAALWTLPILYVEVPDSIFNEIHFPTWSVLADAPWPAVIGTGAIVAIVASAETLLCATAVDQLHNGERTRYGRELMAQGIGNMVGGMVGALPMTGVIVRSSANIHAGAQTRLSAILHGAWLLILVVLAGTWLRLVPTACLAGILVYTGYKLVDPKSILKLKKYGWGEVVIYAATVIVIVVEDLLIGVATGLALSIVKLAWTLSHLRTTLDTSAGHHQTVLKLEGAATFLQLPQLAARLEQVPRGAEFRLDVEQLQYIDHACLDLLKTWSRQHEASGGTVLIDWDHMNMNLHAGAPTSRPASRVA